MARAPFESPVGRVRVVVRARAPAKLASPRAAIAGQPQLRTAASAPSAPLARAALCAPVMMADDMMTETPLRSFVKAAGWRFTAGVVTACTSFIFTGSLAAAAAIVGWDLFSKSGTMFIGERLWNKVKWGKEGGSDSSKRSLAKALAWRLFAATNTLFASLVLTKGKAGVAGKIAGSDSVIKTILFYFYERAWSTITWGRLPGAAEAAARPLPPRSERVRRAAPRGTPAGEPRAARCAGITCVARVRKQFR